MSYRTTELEVAAFLKARGHQVQQAIPKERIVTFLFDDSVVPDVDAYFGGARVPAKELFEAHRCLRTLIQQVKEHKNNTTEQNRLQFAKAKAWASGGLIHTRKAHAR